jgi:DNA-binding Lrp family transcriptional regulator
MIWQTITEARAVKLLLDSERRNTLGAFMHGPCSITQAAEKLGWSLKTVHDRVRTLEMLGLLRVTHLEARRGRPIKHYEAVADGFFVPFHATSAASFQGFITETLEPAQKIFINLFARAGIELIDNPEEAGFRLYAQDGAIVSDLTPTAERFDFLRDLLKPDAPALMLTYIPLNLTHTDAKELQREMMNLLERYTNRNGPEHFVAHVGLTPGDWTDEV